MSKRGIVETDRRERGEGGTKIQFNFVREIEGESLLKENKRRKNKVIIKRSTKRRERGKEGKSVGEPGKKREK